MPDVVPDAAPVLTCRTLESGGFPQDVGENAVDWTHFEALHDWPDFPSTGAPVEGEKTVTLMVRRPLPLIRHKLALAYLTTLAGVGGLHARVPNPGTGAGAVIIIHGTAVSPGRMQVRIAVTFDTNEAHTVEGRTPSPPKQAVARLMGSMVMKWVCRT
ncbi:hypothetical protein CTZ27_31985 [Streptomyces griseocarneus]|nr:hypothetical protein CTZ27_31985 [Streptomyces griseocarneus]